MKLNTKILKGLSEAQTDKMALGEKYLKILKSIIKNVNFGKLASVDADKSVLRGIKIENNPPKGARGFRDIHYHVQVIIQYTPTSIDVEVPGFEMRIRFGDNDYWRDIESPNRRNLRGVKRVLSKDPGFSEEEITQKLKELKKIFEEIYNSDMTIVDRLSK